MKIYKKNIIFLILTVLLISVLCTTISAVDTNNTEKITKNMAYDTTQIESTGMEDKQDPTDSTLTKKTDNNQLKEENNTNIPVSELSVNVKNTYKTLNYDKNNETAITKNITPLNDKPDISKLGTEYKFADENGIYTIAGEEIRRVMKLDSYCQQEYGFVPKYTFFRPLNSNTKYVISREKWNVIARSLNKYHVDQGFTSVNTPYSITVNLANQNRYYPVYYDAQEYINGHQYTCGPTTMSMISQLLNCYSSERKLSDFYPATPSDGTDETAIIRRSPQVHMKLTNIANNKNSVITALSQGSGIYWHIRGHYMCIIDYNNQTDRFLALNPSGPSHNINAVGWISWTQVMNTDKGLKENGFMKVTPYWTLTSQELSEAKYYYYNMGGKYTTPSNEQRPNDNKDNTMTVTIKTPQNIPTIENKTTLNIKFELKNTNHTLNKVNILINNQTIATPTLINSTATIEYEVTSNMTNIELLAEYDNNINRIVFNKNSSGQTFTNYTNLSFEKIITTRTTGKMGDRIYFNAYVRDAYNNRVNNGQVIFKINGNTIKENGKAKKINVTNGFASLGFTIPAYSAKNYTILAVYVNKTTRLEDTNTLIIQKSDSNITDLQISKNGSISRIEAKIVDIYQQKVLRPTKVTIKINGKTVINKHIINDSFINLTVDLSVYKIGNHKLTIIAGENGLYNKSTLETVISKP